MKIINLTPHSVTVMPLEGDPVTFEAAGQVARVGEVVTGSRTIDTENGPIEVHDVYYTDVLLGLPDPQPGVTYLVSRVAAAASDRADLLFPYAELRDDEGQIIGCRALGRFTDSSSSHSTEEDSNE